MGQALVASTAAYFGLRQLRATASANRARFLVDLTRWHQDDPELRDFFYRVDYGRWRFDVESFRLSDDEHHIDRLLMLYGFVEHFIQIGVLREAEIGIVQFEASQLVNNAEVQKYLSWLDDEFKDAAVPGPAFKEARALARRFGEKSEERGTEVEPTEAIPAEEDKRNRP